MSSFASPRSGLFAVMRSWFSPSDSFTAFDLSADSSEIVEVTPNASLQQLNFVAVVLYVPNDDAVGP